MGAFTSIQESQESADALLRTVENDLRESDQEDEKEERVLNELCGTGILRVQTEIQKQFLLTKIEQWYK